MSDTTYDRLKWIAQVLLPALTVFVGVVLKCFHVGYTDIVLTIMTAFDAFLGALLGISNTQYNRDGDVGADLEEEEENE